MKTFAILSLAVAAANANAIYSAVSPPAKNTTSVAPPTYVTSVLPKYTTVCEAGATVSYGPSSYSTVSSKTTLTIPNYTIVTPIAPAPTKPAESAPTYAAPGKPSAPAPVAPVYPTNGTAPAPPAPTGTAPGAPGSTPGAPGSTPAPAFPGAAGKTGLSLLAVAGALAAFL